MRWRDPTPREERVKWQRLEAAYAAVAQAEVELAGALQAVLTSGATDMGGAERDVVALRRRRRLRIVEDTPA